MIATNDLEVIQKQYCTIQDLYHRTITAVYSFIQVLIHMSNTLSGRRVTAYDERSYWVPTPKSGHGRLREWFLTTAFHGRVFQSQFKRGSESWS